MIAATNINLGLGLIWAIRIGFFVGFCFRLILSWICDKFSDLFELVCFV